MTRRSRTGRTPDKVSVGVTAWVPGAWSHPGTSEEPQRPPGSHPPEDREPGALTSEAHRPRGLTLLLLGVLAPLTARLQVPMMEQIRGDLQEFALSRKP